VQQTESLEEITYTYIQYIICSAPLLLGYQVSQGHRLAKIRNYIAELKGETMSEEWKLTLGILNHLKPMI